MNNGRVSFVVAALAAAAVAALAGVVVALPSLRLGGLALALATLALAFTGDQLVFQVDSVRNGSAGWSVPAPSLGPFDFSDDRTMAMLLLILALAISWVIHNLERSATGRAIFAVRSSEVAASTAGISHVRAKLALFAVSAAIAGFGGAMLASVMSPFSNTTTPAFAGLVWLAVTVTFGVRRPAGAILAGLVFALFPEVLSALTRWETAPWVWIPTDVRLALDSSHTAPILFGLGAISLAREPDGALALTARGLRERRERRASRRGGVVPPAPVPPKSGEPGTSRRVTTPFSDATGSEQVTAPAHAEADAAPDALALEGIRAGYGDVEVLHGVDLAVPPGHAVALLGANGAGKSTLAAVAAGLLSPSEGRVLRDGRDVIGEPAFVRARGGLLLAPEARGVFPGLTVDDNLTIRLRRPSERERAYERFPILGERRRQVAGLLSGGEQQMLALAAALVAPPAVFVADEPSLGLAPLAVDAVFAALAEMRDLGVALLLIEEKAREAFMLADTVAFVRLGRIVWCGPRDEVGDEVLDAAYLGDT
ncbi:MAG: ATP-binding cassette domain-containing protein [Acidimicrobiia bacterium]|nr:ATP-binding cassette domain-containing protein [Acidimicrobiia bacterium]